MHGGKRAGAGRKRVIIDLEKLERLCHLRCGDEELAAMLDVDVRTIERRRRSDPTFAAAIARGSAAISAASRSAGSRASSAS